MKRHPARPPPDVEQRVQNRPVGDRIAAVAHRLRLAEGRCDRARIEMIAADHDRRGELAARDEIIQRDAELRAIALTEPADARGEPLKVHLLLRELDPARELLVVRKELEDQLIGAVDILRIAGERDPAERTLPFAEE